MGALPRRPVTEGAVKTLFDALHELHHQAGWPSLRDMAAEVGCSHTTISVAFSGPRVPRWGLLELIVETLHGDTEQFHRLWLASAASPVAVPDGAPAGAATGTPRPAADPAATAGPPVPRQLPGDIAGFVGRDEALSALDRLDATDPAGPPRIAAISGTAGVGKTALAVHWAHRVAKRFPDGQLYVDLRGYDPGQPMSAGEALGRLIRALGSPSQPIPTDVAERAARWRTLLSGQRVLLVLDNANSAAHIRDLLPGDGASVVLVTSRDSLPGLVARHGAARVNLDVLTPAAAVDVLVALLGERAAADRSVAAQLAARCAFLPLALRIAVELAASRPRAALGELVAELGDESRRLDLLAAGDDEYTAVRAVFSWSCRALPAADLRVFQLLGAHPCRDLDEVSIAGLIGTDQPTARRSLDTLRRGHLIAEGQSGRFEMHDLLRDYAAELARQLPTADRDAAAARLATDYVRRVRMALSVADATDPARRWLDLERPNLLAIARVQPAAAAELSGLLADHLDLGAHYVEAAELHALAVQAAQTSAVPGAEAAAGNALGVARRRLGDYAAATEAHRAALVAAAAAGDAAAEAAARHGLGTVLWRAGRFVDARDELQRALELWVLVGDRVQQGTLLYGLGTVFVQMGEYEQSVAHHQRALQVHRELGNRLGESRASNNLGVAYERLGRLTEARDQFQRALELNRAIGNHVGVAVAQTNLGNVATKLGEFAEATTNLEAALVRYRAVGYRVGESEALTGLASVAIAEGRPTDALGPLHLAVTLAAEVGERESQITALIALGEAFHALSAHTDAAARFDAAIDLAVDGGDRYQRARALVGRAEVARDLGDLGGAADRYSVALRLFQDLTLPEAAVVAQRLDALGLEVRPAG